MNIDKYVMQKIVKCDISNINSLIRTCKKFNHLITDNDNLMGFVALSYIDCLVEKVSFHCKRLTNSNFITTNILIEHSTFSNIDQIIFTIVEDDGFITKKEYAIDAFVEYIKQPSMNNAVENLLTLHTYLKNIQKYSKLPEKYVHVYDLLCNLEYICKRYVKDTSSSLFNSIRNTVNSYWTMIKRTDTSTQNTIVTISACLLFTTFFAGEVIRIHKMLKND